MKTMNIILKKCKSLSRLRRSSSYSSLRSQSTRDQELWGELTGDERRETVFVGSLRRRYMINAKLLDHPLLNALIDKSKHKSGDISVKCEVVIFDHLLWMLENADPNLSKDSLEELAQLYAY